MTSRDARLCPAGCSRPVIWAVTEAGRRQALNPEPDEAGNVAAYRDATGTWRARTLTGGARPAPPEKRYMPHAAVCEPLRAGSRPGTAPARPLPEVLPAGVVSLAAWRVTHPRRRDKTGKGRQ